MRDEKPSRTAWRAAVRRAAHQVLDDPIVFDDPLALRIVGADADGRSPDSSFDDPRHRRRNARHLRAFLAVRSRLAEDELARRVERGVRQYVLLGAGLDTFPYRNPHAGLRVFEVDHPATQAWKHTLLGLAQIAVPPSVTFVPVNFEERGAFDGLMAAGFDRSAPACFVWLGVTRYLAEATVDAVLGTIASMPEGSSVVFDYALANSQLPWRTRLARVSLERHFKRVDEPWLTTFVPRVLARRMDALGFRHVHDFGAAELNATYFNGRQDGLRVDAVGHIVTASV